MESPNIDQHTVMNGVILRFFVYENYKCHGLLAYEWLLEAAKALGMPGGTAYRSIAGYGRHGVLHEQHFFELAGAVPVQIVFVLSSEEAQRLLDKVASEEVSFFYTKGPVEYGVIGLAS